MAALLVALFFCLPPQAYLYPAAQKCSVILPVLPASWSQPFCSFFSCAYVMSFHGRRRRAGPTKQEGEVAAAAAGGLMQKMRAHFLLGSSCRSSKISSRDRSWSCWHAPRGSQLMLLFISWSLLLLLLGMPCLAKGSSEQLLRVDGQTGYTESWHRGSKGTDVLSQPAGISGRRYKHSEPPPGRPGEGLPAKVVEEPEWRSSDSTSVNQVPSSDGNRDEKIGRESSGGEPSSPPNLERFSVSGLLRDCLRVKCSPLASFGVKQPSSLDENRPFPTFQGPITSAPHVAIVPPFLEWGSQPVFAPRIASLIVLNTCNSSRLKVFQPFSTDVQFYTTGFEEKVVDPGDELSIPVVFLPRAEGVADAMLIVQTSAGGFLVQAQGRGIGSPYKVQPLQGLRVTSGETLQHTITLHNPHDEVLRVGEVYAWPSKVGESSPSSDPLKSGECEKETASNSKCGDTQQREAIDSRDSKSFLGGAAVIQMRPPGQLEIGPHSSYPIAEFEFSALTADKYYGSLHIKLSGGMQGADDVLILPIDVQVGGAKGDASPVEPVVDVLEFGILTKEDQTSKVDVVLYNPGTEAVQVEDISLQSEDENIVYIEYKKGLVLPPKSETGVAVVTYKGIEETVPSDLFECHPRELLRDRKLIVRTNSSVSPLVEVPYRALVFHGSVDCDPAQSSVGYVSESGDESGDAVISAAPEGGAVSEQRVRFSNEISVSVSLFKDIELTARTRNEQLLPSESVCCDESVLGHLAASVGEQSIAAHSELLYPVVQVGTDELQWVNVTNPSDKPLYVQVLLSSKTEVTNNEGGAVSDSLHCGLSDDTGSVFSFAVGAISELVVEPHGEGTLGPVVFSPPQRRLWTGLLSLWNNLTQVEWLPMQGSGGSASLTFLDGEDPVDLLQLDFNVTQGSMISGFINDNKVGGFLDSFMSKTVCSQRVSRGFLAKNTGDVHLDVSAVELVGGGCSGHGFQIDSCDGFSLAPGQSAELFVSFQPDFTAQTVFQRDIQFITSTGIVQILLLANLPDSISHMCLEMTQSTKLESAFLFLSIVALVVVLVVFFRMIVQEMALQQERVSTSRLKSISQHTKVGARQNPPIVFSSANSLVVTKTSNHSSVVAPGRLKCSSGEPEVQSRTGDGTGASGPGRPKESIKGLVRVLKVVTDSFTATIGSTAGFEDCSSSSKAADMAPPAGLPGLRVKIPNSGALNGQKSSSGSPMRGESSPSSSSFRKGMTEKRNQARFDGVQAKVAPEPLEESPAPVKQSPPVLKSPKSVVIGSSLIFAKQVLDGENSHHLQSSSPPTSDLVCESPKQQRSPRKGSHFNLLRQGLSPKAQPAAQSAGSAASVVSERVRRKKRRSNVGLVKHESASKGKSGSSSPSSPASPATPASPSRPVSPLLHSELQSNSTTAPPGFSSPSDSSAAPPNMTSPLAKLDVTTVERHSNSTNKASAGKSSKETSGPSIYRRSDSLSVDVASTALREMAQAKATDLSWSTLSGKGNKIDKTNDGSMGKRGVPKDWATIARKPTNETASANKEGHNFDSRSWVHHNGQGGSSGPTLTPSATFPRRQDRGVDTWSFPTDETVVQEVIKPVGTSPTLVPVSTIPPAARAPGAKIVKPFLDESSSRDGRWGPKGEGYEVFDRKSNEMPQFMSEITSEDQRVYDIWGNHFGEISRCATQQIGPITATGLTNGAPLQSLPVLNAAPSYFSAFPQPTFPGMDISILPALTNIKSSGFSVFSQAPDVETFRLPSTLRHSLKTGPVMPAVYTDVNGEIHFGHSPRNVLKGIHGGGGGGVSQTGSPRKPRGPYSPPLGPSPMANEFVPLAVPATTSDPSCSFWSGSNTNEVFTTTATTAIHSRS